MSREQAQEILKRQSELETVRSSYEHVWQEVADYCAPDAPDFLRYRLSGIREGQAERNDRRARKVYDTTIISAVDRLASGLESLITPQSEKWHGISTSAVDDEETDEEREWGELLRDFLFEGVRYQAGANFVPAMQQCYSNVVRFGPAYLYAEEVPGGLIRYCSIPTAEGFIQRDRWGAASVFHRRYQRTVKQIAEIVGFEKLSPKLKDLANDPVKCMQTMTLTQAIEKREEAKRAAVRIDGKTVFIDMPWASRHVVEEEEIVAKEAGFRTFPIACFNWGREEGDDYGTSQCIKALTVVKTQNAVGKTGLRLLQQVADPALGGPSNLDYIPDLNPGTYHPGMVGKDGRMLVQPINTGANPSAAFEYLASNIQVIKDMMFVNLFQILVDNPQMTATEALIRNEEKGALLGPAGSVIQSGLSQLLDREMSILEDKGLYAPESRFVPPESLAGKQIRVSFTSPLDNLRRSAEARDTIQLVQTAAEFAKVSGRQDILDNIDGDEALRVIQGAGRAPQRVLKRKDEVVEERAARAQQAQQMQNLTALQQTADVAHKAVPAMIEARDAGLMPQ